jgi:hypothetical protein
MNFPSALPFNKLGVGVGLLLLAVESLADFGFRVGRPPASGLDGMLLPSRLSPLGGFGKELMLTVFRRPLVAAAAGVLLFVGAGDAEEGARKPLRGAGDFGGLGMAAVPLRLLGTERVGREVSGPIEGRARGRAVAMFFCRCGTIRGIGYG